MLAARPAPRTSMWTCRDVLREERRRLPRGVAAADDDDLVAAAALRLDVRRGVVDARRPRSARARRRRACGTRRRSRSRPRARAPTRRPRARSRTGVSSQCEPRSRRARRRSRAPNFSAWASARAGERLARDARREAEVVLDLRARAGLTAGRVRLDDEHVEPLRRAVDGRRQPARPGAAIDHVVDARRRRASALKPRQSATSAFVGLLEHALAAADEDRHVARRRRGTRRAAPARRGRGRRRCSGTGARCGRGTPAGGASPPSRASR